MPVRRAQRTVNPLTSLWAQTRRCRRMVSRPTLWWLPALGTQRTTSPSMCSSMPVRHGRRMTSLKSMPVPGRQQILMLLVSFAPSRVVVSRTMFACLIRCSGRSITRNSSELQVVVQSRLLRIFQLLHFSLTVRACSPMPRPVPFLHFLIFVG